MSDESSRDEARDEPAEAGVEDLRGLLATGAKGRPEDAVSTLLAVRNWLRRRRMLQTGLVAGTAAVVAAAATLVAVSGGGGRSYRPLVAARPTAPLHPLTGALVSFDACSDYLSYIKREALAEVGPYGLAGDGVAGYDNSIAEGTARPGPAVGATASVASPDDQAASPQASAPAASGTSATPTFSTTNDQVAGVDEPDTVKTDGRIVVTLVGSTLRVLNLDAQVIGSLQLPGDTGGGMLLAGDTVVVLSSSPSTLPGTTGYVPGPSPQDLSASPDGSANPGGEQARATVVNLSDPANPRMLRSFRFDGDIVAARLVNGQVRLVLRSDQPRLGFVNPQMTSDPQGATAANSELIQHSTVSDWLPYWQAEGPDGTTTAREPLSGCESVARPRQASGLSTVTVFSLNPSATAPGPGTSVVSAGDIVYATADHLYIAGPTSTSASPDPYAGAAQSGCCAILPPAGASTAIYEFSMAAPGAPVFEGAGTVPGWLIDSYAMDVDAQNHLRVASTAHSSAGATQSQITVLDLSGTQLVPVGSVGELGSGEFIKTVRFTGNVAYVVTFQTFDPLYVVDLANPQRPALVGQLAQPGYSEFLYPLSSQLLLAVSVQITSGEPSGLVVNTYNVSNPARPERIDSSTLATGYQYVATGYDPHAFLWWPATNLALVSIPADDQYGATGLGFGVAAFKVDASGRLTRSATLSHGSTSTTRSAVIDNKVWAFGDSGVLTANLTDLPATTWHGY
jgi:uncharacterized secreted protein with C-terminal beta-propeller domain